MNYNSYTNFYPKNEKEPRTLSSVGSVIYSVVATVLLLVCAFCLRTDGENAMLCILAPLFTIGASYFLAALLVHGRMALFVTSALSSVICAYVLCADIFRSLLCLGAFAVALCVYLSTRKKYFTHSGNICLCAAVYAGVFAAMLCVLCIEKYGAVNYETLGRAYDSFKSIVMSVPRESLAQLETGALDVAAEDIEYYRSLVDMLDDLLGITLYVVPSLFLCICAIGGFITVRGVRSNRKMLALPDTVGIYEISSVSAFLFIVFNLLTLFVNLYTPLGIAVFTVCAPLELGLAYAGLVFVLGWLKLHNKGPLFYIVFVLLGLFMTSACIAILAYTGAYRSIYLSKMRKMKEKLNNNNADHDGQGGNED